MEDAGGTYYDGVTSRDWSDHVEWISQFLDVLGTEIRHDESVQVEPAEE